MIDAVKYIHPRPATAGWHNIGCVRGEVCLQQIVVIFYLLRTSTSDGLWWKARRAKRLPQIVVTNFFMLRTSPSWTVLACPSFSHSELENQFV